MTLDLSALSRQIVAMGRTLQETGQSLEERLTTATNLLRAHAADFQALENKARSSNTPWPIAGLVERPDTVYLLPEGPSAYTVAATDGSQIEPDRHGSVLCHLINIGWAAIRYGDRPQAWLASEPTLYYDDADLYLTMEGRRTLVAGHLLDIKRNVAEMARLAQLVEETERDIPMVAIADGLLVLRAMEGWRLQEFRRNFLPRFQESLSHFQALSVPVVGYISRPRSYELTSLLRVAACPYAQAVCSQQCASVVGKEPCAALVGIPDRLLMERLPLRLGERSARFRAFSSAEGPPTYFFYLNVADEIARIEVPDWVTFRPELMDLVHWVAHDQCRRGNGYPRVLTEAHERAVLAIGDRQQFEQLVEATVARSHLSERTSAKERSKRVRGL